MIKFLERHFGDNAGTLMVAVVAMMLISIEPSYAQNFGGVQSFLNKIVNNITGPIGVSIAALAVIAIGFSFLTGRMDWTFAVAVIVGIAIIFGGAAFVKGLKATGGGGKTTDALDSIQALLPAIV
ncbi:MAG: TrbC/VirB2 family protein [Pseudomonadota bacterium]